MKFQAPYKWGVVILANQEISRRGGMYLVILVIVIVTVTVLLQCLSCSFGQNYNVNIADDYDLYDNDKKQDTKSVLNSYPKTWLKLSHYKK